jgi:hypothetical protein
MKSLLALLDFHGMPSSDSRAQPTACQGTVAQSGGGPDRAAPVRKSKIVSDYRSRKEWLRKNGAGLDV